MITARRPQRSFADGLISEAVEDLWEPWMRHADQALEDEALLLIIQQELAKRCREKQDARPPGDPRGSGAQNDAAEDMCAIGATKNSPAKCAPTCLPRIHTRLWREGSGRQDHGTQRGVNRVPKWSRRCMSAWCRSRVSTRSPAAASCV